MKKYISRKTNSLNLKHIKTFESYVALSESTITETQIKPKMSISKTGILTLSDGKNSVNIQMINSSIPKEGSNEGAYIIHKIGNRDASSENRIIDCDSWRVEHGIVAQEYSKMGWTFTVLKDDDTPVNDGTHKSEILLYIAVPKGYEGVINGRSVEIGKINSLGQKVVSGHGTETWGFYNMKDLASKTSVPAYTKISIVKKEVNPDQPAKTVQDLTILDGFELDKWDITENAKKELNKLIQNKDKIKGVYVLTGASKDYDESKAGEPSGHKIGNNDATKYQWDLYLVYNRFNTVKKFLADNGIKVLPDTKNEFKDDKPTKIYGFGNSKDLKHQSNRILSAKIVTK